MWQSSAQHLDTPLVSDDDSQTVTTIEGSTTQPDHAEGIPPATGAAHISFNDHNTTYVMLQQ
eukprot:9760256-Ditylum_brightwellii.AAC.1